MNGNTVFFVGAIQALSIGCLSFISPGFAIDFFFLPEATTTAYQPVGTFLFRSFMLTVSIFGLVYLFVGLRGYQHSKEFALAAGLAKTLFALFFFYSYATFPSTFKMSAVVLGALPDLALGLAMLYLWSTVPARKRRL